MSIGIEIIVFALFGFSLGVLSGLTPGLHVNSLAFLLAAGATSFMGLFPPEVLGVAMVSAAVTHTFLDIIPSIVLGVPDESMALTALPGHRLVLDGKGNEAIRLSASGSMLAVALSFVIALPLTLIMVKAYGSLLDENPANMALLLSGVVLFLLVTERAPRPGYIAGIRHRFMAVVVLVASGLLGYYTLTHEEVATALVGEPNLLMPLFTGLFGVPILAVSAFQNSRIPEQIDSDVLFSRLDVTKSAVDGGIAGAIVGWIPGMSSAVAATLVQTFMPGSETEEKSMRSFIVAVSGVNTSNAIFALFALYFIQRSRTGVMVALSDIGVKITVTTLFSYLVAIGLVSLLAFVATITIGRYSFRFVNSVDYRLLSLCIMVLLVILTLVFSGVPGIPVLVAGTVIGLVPNYTRIKRVHCMGCLLLPLIYFYLTF
ncbi:MAG: tripartite tricarboxylate transporter permease [Halobacteria archaeon]|nr:tripartite tricarboxylate transporter permease [Halobacteria archaeon]